MSKDAVGIDVDSDLSDVAEILSKLRTVNIRALDHVITMSKIAQPFLPGELAKALDIMLLEINLVKAFAEQARAYDRTDDLGVTMEKLQAMIRKGGEIGDAGTE